MPFLAIELVNRHPRLRRERELVTAHGHSTLGDGGHGEFYWDPASIAPADGGCVFAVTGVTTGRWVRIYSGALNVRWFGATGDGTTYDTVAIRACFAAAVANGNRGVYFPGSKDGGAYRVSISAEDNSTQVLVNIDNKGDFEVYGDGFNSVIWWDDDYDPTITYTTDRLFRFRSIAPAATNLARIRFHDLHIRGNNGNALTGVGYRQTENFQGGCVVLDRDSGAFAYEDIVVERCLFANTFGFSLQCFANSRGGLLFRDNISRYNGNGLNTSVPHCKFINNIWHSSEGIETGAPGCVITGNTFTVENGVGGAAQVTYGGGDLPPVGSMMSLIANNHFDNSGWGAPALLEAIDKSAITLAGVENVTVSGNTFRNFAQTAISLSTGHPDLGSPSCKHITIAGNTIREDLIAAKPGISGSTIGIYVSGVAQDVVIAGNTVRGIVGTYTTSYGMIVGGASRVLLANNVITACGKGAELSSDTTVKLAANVIANNDTVGLNLNSGAGYTLLGNTLSGNGVFDLNVEAATTVVSRAGNTMTNVNFVSSASKAEPVLATGAGHTVDDLISALQAQFLFKQS